jgi:hypothetical protein
MEKHISVKGEYLERRESSLMLVYILFVKEVMSRSTLNCSCSRIVPQAMTGFSLILLKSLFSLPFQAV